MTINHVGHQQTPYQGKANGRTRLPSALKQRHRAWGKGVVAIDTVGILERAGSRY